ncbi:hypothetical protein INR49_007932 [Caranx melampygus]|nr:hypothetical protein INR49_007932 [Caranx melampygus]
MVVERFLALKEVVHFSKITRSSMRLLCLLQLVCLAGCTTSRRRDWAHHGAPMFADLTVREMKAVRAYLHGIRSWSLLVLIARL